MQEKTEKPTSRRLQKAKEKGEAPKSTELASTLSLLGGLLALWYCASWLKKGLASSLLNSFSLKKFDVDNAMDAAFSPVILPVAVILLAIFLVMLLGHLSQTGWMWSRKVKRKKGKPRPFYTLAKFFMIGVIGFFSFRRRAPPLFFLPASTKAILLFKLIFFLMVEITLGLLLLALGDWFYQRWKFYKEMRMSVQEVKDEKREEEGDVLTKSKMRKR